MTNCCQVWLLLGLVLNKFKKTAKKSIIPRVEIYLPVLIFSQNHQSYSTLLSSHSEPTILFVSDNAVR